MPNTAINVLSAVNAVLPGPGSKFAMQGKKVGLNPAVRKVITLSERAAGRNNQR
jgi:hypothetical protein